MAKVPPNMALVSKERVEGTHIFHALQPRLST